MPAHQPGDLLQHLVAGDVAVAVVDRLEQIHVDDAHGQCALVAHGARDLLLHRFDEMAAVVHLGQRIVGGELVDLLVVTRLHAAVADELQDALAQGDVVAVDQRRLRHRRIVQPGGVGGAEVAHPVGVAVAPELAVQARDAVVRDVQVGLLRAAHAHPGGVDVRTPAQAFAVDHHHAGRARRGRPRTVAQDGPLRGGWIVGVPGHARAAGRCGPECTGSVGQLTLPIPCRGAQGTVE